MVFFFYGEDSYRIRQKVNSVIEGYQTKHKSGLNFGRFDLARDEEGEKLENFLASFSMFAEKKLAVVNNLFEAAKSVREKFLAYLAAGTIFKTADSFLVIAQPLERTTERKSRDYILKDNKELFKKLTAGNAGAEEFDYLSGGKLEDWIKKTAAAAGASIDGPAARKLALFVGSDLWQMKNEIDKLISFAGRGAVGEAMVDEMVKAKNEIDIFRTIDALAQRNKRQALELLHRHLAEGESEIYLLTMLVYQFRNLLLIKSEVERGAQFQMLAKTIKLHPFVLRKSFEQGRAFTLPALKKIYERLLELDIAIKSGRVESAVALDLVVGEICG